MRSLDRISHPGRESPADDVRQRLRELPVERQAPYDWAEFRRRERERARPRRSPVKWEHAALAAGITALIASVAMWGRTDHQLPDLASNGAVTVPAAVDPAFDEELNQRFNAAAVEASLAAQAAVAAQFAALARAPASKRWLERHAVEPAVVRMGPRLAVANLEDRIAWVDDALTDAQFASVNTGRMQALEQERARLVSSLAQVRYAQTLVAQMP
jgi:hypothetical protein